MTFSPLCGDESLILALKNITFIRFVRAFKSLSIQI